MPFVQVIPLALARGAGTGGWVRIRGWLSRRQAAVGESRRPMADASGDLTSKRQATFPRELCESLGLEPGDELRLVPRVEDGERVWLLQVVDKPDRPWFGRLRKYATGTDDHSMDAIRESIRRGRSAERRS